MNLHHPWRELFWCHFAEGEQKSGVTCPGSSELEPNPRSLVVSKGCGSFRATNPSGTRSVGYENSQFHEHQVATTERTAWLHDLFHPHPIVCQREGWGWLVARSLGCPVTGWTCLTASQSRLPELVLERPWPHLAGTLYLCPWTQKGPCLGPATLIPHAPDCPSPSASRKAHFVESKD